MKTGSTGWGLAPDACGTPWATAGAALVGQWLHDFSWDRAPLDQFITGVDVAFDQYPAAPLWRGTASGRPLPAGARLTGLPPLNDAPFNMWHPLWLELIDVWHLAGAWLHPETFFSLDRLAFAEQRAYLHVGCRDRANPSAPRRYDPRRSPVFRDQGVIAFPLRTFRALDHVTEHGPEAAMLLCAGTAVAESAVHEALEMHQSSPGVPVLDPHTPGLTVNVTVHWADAVPATTGSAHAGRAT
ncbi:hypothetical protein [Streptomyces aureoversilis]|uniref:Uncharacterized protein n=1 Tax=Streptomyces aureoversilis TaxID=67277 RepID=A0ABW0A575_9ACTN